MCFTAVLGSELPSSVVVIEITTVASYYSIAQFYRTGQIAGDAFRLQISAMMPANIVDVETGEISNVLLESPNADQTNSLRLTRSLGNVLNAAVRPSPALEILTFEGGQHLSAAVIKDDDVLD